MMSSLIIHSPVTHPLNTHTHTLSHHTGTSNDYDYDESSRYDNRKLMTIRQISSNDSSHLIDLTPPPIHHDYSNIGPDGEVLDKTNNPLKPHIPPKPKMAASNGASIQTHDQQTRLVYDLSTAEDELYDNRQVEKVLSTRLSASNDGVNLYDDPQSLNTKKTTTTSATPAGMYDDPDEIISPLRKGKAPPSRMYDNPNEIIDSLKKGHGGDQNPAENVYDIAADVNGGQRHAPPPPFSPKFDDTIYMSRGKPQPPDAGSRASAVESMCK